jgi:uncharacterized membrane protein
MFMHKKLLSILKPLFRPLVVIALVFTLVLGHSGDALAARSGGGRIGGGSFRAPSRPYSAPRTYAPPGGGYGYPGGGFGFPLIWSPFVFGGGGLFSILIFLAVANFLVQSFRRSREDNLEYGAMNPTVSVARLQVGLLASARELQADLDKIARTADTSSSQGLSQVLQETTLAILRHPEYWTHATSTMQQARLQAAENEFNRLALAERSKFSRETLSNVKNQLREASTDAVLTPTTEGGKVVYPNQENEPGEYIVATILAAVQGDLKLPAIHSSENLRVALQQLGGVSSDRLMALEILWAPQAEGDVLTRDDLLLEYPDLKLV